MGRPRKDRLREHAGSLAAELRRLLVADLGATIEALRGEHRRELAELRRSVAALERRVDLLVENQRTRRAKVGRWVPGGPGRPPKDAAARIAAFKARARAVRTK